MIQCLIVDDEFLARERIKNLLDSHHDFCVMGDAKNGEQALEQIHLLRPDVLFLDIRMPLMDGLQMARSLEKKPLIVYVTAHDQYALNAFEVSAFDYLLKPIDEDRFTRVLARIRGQLQLQKQDGGPLVSVGEDPKDGFLHHLELEERGFKKVVKLSHTFLIETFGNYLKLHSLDGVDLIRLPLKEFVRQVDPASFIQIHRTTVVNLRFIKHCRYQGNNEFLFHLKTGDQVRSSRRFKTAISENTSLSKLR